MSERNKNRAQEQNWMQTMVAKQARRDRLIGQLRLRLSRAILLSDEQAEYEARAMLADMGVVA